MDAFTFNHTFRRNLLKTSFLAQEILLNRPSQGYCPERFFNHTFRRVLFKTSFKRAPPEGCGCGCWNPVQTTPRDRFVPIFQRATSGSQNSPAVLAPQAFFALLDTLRGFCAILRPLNDTLRGVKNRPPGRRGVGGRKPPPLVSDVLTRTTKGRRISTQATKHHSF